MCRILVTIVSIIIFASSAFAGGTRISFVSESNREQDTLEQDAELIASQVQKAKYGDNIDGITASGKQVFSFSPKDNNRLKLKKEQTSALNGVRAFYIQHIKSSDKPAKIDIAGALKRIIERFNSESNMDRYVIVLFSSGIYKGESLDFSNGYPSDSFIKHSASPFSRIGNNETGKEVSVIFIPEDSAYVNTFHRNKIERFYSILLNNRRMRLLGFTDHRTAAELIKRGSQVQKPVPLAEDPDGKLILYHIPNEPVKKSEVRQGPTFVVKPVPKALSCSILQPVIRSGQTLIWVSVRDAQNNAVKDLRPEYFVIQERDQGKSRIIPSSSIKIQSKQNIPFGMVLLRDISSSMTQQALNDSATAIKRFLDQLMSNDICALVNFHDQTELVHGFSTDKNVLKQSVVPPSKQGGTALYDAIAFCVKLISQQASNYPHAVIAYTDGNDNTSQSSPWDVAKSARQSSVPVFLVGVGDVNQDALRQFATDTGGLYFSASTTNALKQVYQKISGILGDSVLVSYPTSAKNDVNVDMSVQYQTGPDYYQGKASSQVFKRD